VSSFSNAFLAEAIGSRPSLKHKPQHHFTFCIH